MIFLETGLPGAFVIEPERVEDDRGYFARTWCRVEFADRGLSTDLAQCNVSHNARRGTLRGMHYQAAPHAEAKLVRCTRGAIFDAIVDLRPGSPTYRRWFGVELSPEGGRMLYVPEGFAHGFQTLEDATEVAYQMSSPHRPGSARGLRWDDPDVGIAWPPEAPRIISERDLALPSLAEADPS